MKKIAILVSIVMMTVMLVGCGSNDKNVNDNTTKKEASKDTTEKQEKNTDTKEETSKDDDEKSSLNNTQNNEVNNNTEIDQSEAGIQAALDKLTAVNGEVDEQTGNTFSYGYEGVVNIDGDDYYNFRTSWLVSDESGSAHLSYLTNYVVSKDLSKVAEYYDGQLYFN